MPINEIIRPSVGSFIAPTADLSTLAGWSDTRIIALKAIIEGRAERRGDSVPP
jgi:hypothetical protein